MSARQHLIYAKSQLDPKLLNQVTLYIERNELLLAWDELESVADKGLSNDRVFWFHMAKAARLMIE